MRPTSSGYVTVTEGPNGRNGSKPDGNFRWKADIKEDPISCATGRRIQQS